MQIQLLTAATATNSPPVDGTSGFALATTIRGDRGLLIVKSTAGSGTMTVTIRMWGYSAVTSSWSPLGDGAAATKGVINGGAAIAETGTDLIQHAEIMNGLENLDRVFAEVTAIGGTATAISMWLVARR